MTNIIFDFLVDLTKKHWSFVFLTLIPVVFVVIRKYFELSFRQTVRHRWFWIPGGTLIILWVASQLLQALPPSLPGDKLVVAIARFTPISDGAKAEAANVSHRIDRKLRETVSEGAPLIIMPISRAVAYGGSEQTRCDKAIDLCGGGAHVILWGDVRTDEGELFVLPRLTIVRQLREVSIEEREFDAFRSTSPKHLEFKERLSANIADIVALVYGLAYYKIGDWNRGIQILRHVRSFEAHFYKGLCYRERAQQSLHPQEDLDTAIQSYDEILQDSTEQANALFVPAYYNRVNAIALLGLFIQPTESQDYLLQAADDYRFGVETFSREKYPHEWAISHANLGTVLWELGYTAPH